MRSPAELQRRLLAGGDDPQRRALFGHHFAAGPPRKLRALASRMELDTRRGLDLGCGWGVHLAHFGPGSLGLDLAPNRVAFARSLGLEAQVRDLDRPGWSAGLEGFELIFAADLLMHLRDPEVLLAELARPLAPGGALVLCEWIWPERGVLRPFLARRLPGAQAVWQNPEHLRRFSEQELVWMLDGAGFQVEALYAHNLRGPGLATLLRSWLPPRTAIFRLRP